MDNTPFRQASTTQFYQNGSCFMKSIDPTINSVDTPENMSETSPIAEPKLESLNIHSLGYSNNSNGRSILLLDGDERLCVSSEKNFLQRLKIPEDVSKVKVVCIFGNTGEGKSYTLNQTFFNGENVFRTSPDQVSCTLGVWAAFDPVSNVVCLDTEGLLGITTRENQRTRLLLKVLAVSDIIIYRTRAERLQRDMYTFLGGASRAFREHFESALKQIKQVSDLENNASSMGPSVIIFHETRHTNTLRSSAGVSESAEDILRTSFAQLQLDVDAFSSLKYIGIQTKDVATVFTELKNAVQLELDNTTVRSARNPKFIYLTLKGLNEKFKSQITNTTPQLYLPAYFTCQMKCQSCSTGCTLSMGHVDEGKTHFSATQCRFQHQFQNCVYLCKKCYTNGERVVVKPSYQSIQENSWTSLFNYVWSGYIIECRKCGEIYRSRQHWYGNKNPEDGAVIPEIVHIWPGERNIIGSHNSAQRVLDGVSMISDAVVSVGSQPTKAITAWVTDRIAPSYWTPNHEITHCHKCKTPFAPTAPKHHCRQCGKGFCEACSSKYKPVPQRGWETDVRVCIDCYDVDLTPGTPVHVAAVTDDSEVKVRKYTEAVVGSIASVLDIPKGIIKESARPAYWTPDTECLNCWCCGNPFGTLIPLHHCRDCGKGVCDDCSSSRKPVPWRGWDSRVRVCDKCAT